MKKTPFPEVNFIKCPDYELWQRVIQTIKPLRERKNTCLLTKGTKKTVSAISSVLPITDGYEKFSVGNPPPFSCFLDLHGLTHDQAYGQLKNFIVNACDRGINRVFVITGKGVSRQTSCITDKPEKADLLQVQVPRWLEFFPQVKGFQKASPKKGGSGVLCVHLHKKSLL